MGLDDRDLAEARAAAIKFAGSTEDGNVAGSVLELQGYLFSQGFDTGPLDGILGPKTIAARDAAIAAGLITPSGDLTDIGARDAYETRTGDRGNVVATGTVTNPDPGTVPLTSQQAPIGGGSGATGGGGGTATTGGGTTGGGGAATSSTTGTGGGGSGGIPTTPSNAPVPRLRILDGRNRQFYRDGDKWYVTYGLASGRNLIFEATEEEMTNLYGSWRPPAQSATLKSLTQREGYTYAGSIDEVSFTGDSPQWLEDEVQRVTTLALDEGILPEWARQDQAALDILYIAQSEGKSNDWVLQQLSSLDSFKERFPGLQNIQDLLGGDLATSIDSWLEFEQGINQALAAYGKSEQAVTPALVGELLAGGHSLTTIQTTIATFDRMEKFAPAFNAFNSVLAASGLDQMTTLDDMFQFAAGMAPSEMYDIYEASSIAEAMEVAGLGDLFTAEDAIQIGLETEQTLESATQAARKSAEMLLRLRHEVNVGDFGLDHEELIDISFGRAPRSGRNEAEVMDNINRAVTTAKAHIETKRADPFKSFAATGTIRSASLGNLRQTS